MKILTIVKWKLAEWGCPIPMTLVKLPYRDYKDGFIKFNTAGEVLISDGSSVDMLPISVVAPELQDKIVRQFVKDIWPFGREMRREMKEHDIKEALKKDLSQ